MTIRSRITFWFILIILIANAILFTVNVRHIENVLIREVQTRVRLDLNSARRVYNDRIEEIERHLRTSSIHREIIALLQEENRDRLMQLLQSLQQESGLEMLTLVSSQGPVLARAHRPEQLGDSLASNLLVHQAMQTGQPASGTLLLSPEALQREGETFAQRARFTIQFTPGQRPVSHRSDERGMVIGAAVPLYSDDTSSSMAGLLYGSLLLNRRYDFVDTIRDEVFQDQHYQGKSIGMATLFQEDLRIATNVLTEEGERAVGTLMSREVYARVIEKGEMWLDRAFVVNDWQITAYEPIVNPRQEIVGALFVGLWEQPYLQSGNVILIGFLMVVILTTVATLVTLYFSTLLILRPISQIIAMSKKMIQGDLTARVVIRPPGEMGHLCQAIDHMAEAVFQREEKLKDLTRQQIGQSEKLASIGRLAAGIAHEINNPLTGVLTFTHLLRDKPNMTDEDREDLDVVIHETTRVREIVRGLLDFSRESVSDKESLQLNDVVRQTILLIQSQKEFRKIDIALHLSDDIGDRNQLQQVLLNLSLNACEAMPDGGVLTITTQEDNNQVILTVRDTGHGIPSGHIENIFDPFFTTKPIGKGTGLGLSVTYGIVQSHNGSIHVESEEGAGTTFTVVFPVHQDNAKEEKSIRV
jgi:two-component system, NtrC family, sensor kinase